MSKSIYTLMLEVTRRCNMLCQHCLRGGQQRIDMPEQIIDTVLSSFEYISTITFTGGEPFLNPNAILHTMRRIRYDRLHVGAFYISTNGKVFNEEVMDELMYFYEYITDDPGVCQVKVSRDMYHRQFETNRLLNNIYSMREDYPFVYIEDENVSNAAYANSMIPEGRGKLISYDDPITEIDIKEHCGERVILTHRDDGVDNYDGTLYINALGDIIPCLNLSYVSQKKFKAGRYDQIDEYLENCPKAEDFVDYDEEKLYKE